MLLHKDRYYPTSTLIKHGVVVHDSESGDGSSANLISVLKSPGNKPSSHGGFFGAGYHAVTDGGGGYVQIADASAGPYSAPPLNPTWWHVCMPGFVNQTREQWLDQLSYAHILGVAHFIVDKQKEDNQTWPLSFIFADQLKAGLHGYTSHYQVSLAWHETTHTDPGPNFPWDVLDRIIQSLSNVSQQEDEIMYLATLSNGDVVVVGASVRPVSTDEIGPNGPYKGLPRFVPDPGTNWHAWLRAGADEYARRMGI